MDNIMEIIAGLFATGMAGVLIAGVTIWVLYLILVSMWR